MKVKPLVVSPLVGEMAGRPEGVERQTLHAAEDEFAARIPCGISEDAVIRLRHVVLMGEQAPSGLPAISPTRGENICGGLSLPLLRSVRGIVLACEVKTAYPPKAMVESQQALDHDVFRSGRPKNMNVIDSKKLERDAGGKPHTLFLIPL
ncbi:hypothetical protein [Sinorhizobium meliloti]|uniref:hypothetical protein n=1 Tax=Rhizobium meliloti TaxID=382 RepID=UPI001F24A6E6|nr:hypothetical protein [Sinorhizobium meliloti]